MVSLAFLGPEGTYSHEAALLAQDALKMELTLSAQKSLDDVVSAVVENRCDFSVLPVENSSNGPVDGALLALAGSEPGKLYICGEVRVKVHHQLYTIAKSQSNIRRVYSHPQVWGQISSWLQQNLAHASRIDTDSTAQALRQSLQDPESAAISSKLSGDILGVEAIANERINDDPANTTRFLILSRTPTRVPDQVANTTSLIFSGETPVNTILTSFKEVPIRFLWLSPRGQWQYQVLIELASADLDQDALCQVKSLGARTLGCFSRIPSLI